MARGFVDADSDLMERVIACMKQIQREIRYIMIPVNEQQQCQTR
jgi:hypothetical protein